MAKWCVVSWIFSFTSSWLLHSCKISRIISFRCCHINSATKQMNCQFLWLTHFASNGVDKHKNVTNENEEKSTWHLGLKCDLLYANATHIVFMLFFCQQTQFTHAHASIRFKCRLSRNSFGFCFGDSFFSRACLSHVQLSVHQKNTFKFNARKCAKNTVDFPKDVKE